MPIGDDFRYTKNAGATHKRSRKEMHTKIQNHHPTVKPLKLMEYLCGLLKPPEGGVLLDPFCGSGTTLMAAVGGGWSYIGIEREAEYVTIAEKRVAWAVKHKTNRRTLFEGDKDG